MQMKRLAANYWAITIAIALTPLLLWAALQILPTHDDWAGTTTPDFRPFFIKEHFLFYGFHWRPFDTWIGYIAGRNPQLLYPAFNHVCVVAGHLLCTILVCKLLATLGFGRRACNVSTLFFFITPATMATVLAIDSQNQTFALVWGITAFLYYSRNSRRKYLIWPILVFIATLSKENGLMWALICPILAYGFDFIDRRTLKKDILVGIAIMAAYALAIALLPKDITIHPDYEPGILKTVSNVVKFVFSSFVTVDYIYLLHQPSRNLLLAAVTLLLALPFIYYMFIRPWRTFADKRILCTALSLVIAVGPHLGTVYSMMHTYAGLVLVAVIVAWSIEQYQQPSKSLMLAFLLWIIAAVGIDIHLTDASIKSGLIGRQMAREAVRQTGSPVSKAYVVIIEDDYPKLSSFCVIPNEAFGWGLAARHETNYQWPEVISDTTIERTADAFRQAERLGRQVLQSSSYDCVWIVNHEKVYVVKK